MILDRMRPLLCVLHDARSAAPPVLWDVRDEVWPAVDLVQVRAKGLPAGALESLSRGWVGRLAGLGPRVVVNDRLDVALAAGAHGVHLGQTDLPVEVARRQAPRGFLIGASTHSADELLKAEEDGADYAGLGAFFVSRTKPDASALDVAGEGLDTPVHGLAIPVLAIGGLSPDRVAAALQVPAVTGVAVGGAVEDAVDHADAILGLRGALEAAWSARAGAGAR